MERQQKAYKGVIDYFKKKIMDGELRPGEKLPPERDIAERLNVSRNSVREAIRIMDMTGVISSLWIRSIISRSARFVRHWNAWHFRLP